MPNHRELSDQIHSANREAGWWTNLETGGPLDRNFGEMLALAHSELSECWAGIASGEMDHHIPVLKNWHVELADACIRVYDMLGGCFRDVRVFTPFKLDVPEFFLHAEDRLVFLHALLSNALENYRKSNHAATQMYLIRFLDSAFEWAEAENFNLLETILVKCAYNRDRLDHKIENRKLEDGKKI